MKAGETYKGNRAMQGQKFTVISIDNGTVKLKSHNAECFVARSKLQNSIDTGLLIKVDN